MNIGSMSWGNANAMVLQGSCRANVEGLCSLHKLGWHNLIKRFRLRGWWCGNNNSRGWWSHNHMRLWFEDRWVLLRWFLLACPLRCANKHCILWSMQRLLHLHYQLRSANGLPNGLPLSFSSSPGIKSKDQPINHRQLSKCPKCQ